MPPETTAWPDRPEFASMPAALKAQAAWRSFGKEELLFRIGEVPRAIYYIARGEARLRRHSPEGTEIVMQRARNSFLAEASLESPAYHCDAVASSRVEALCFPVSDFRVALAECPGFRGRWTSHLLHELRRTRAQCERMGLRSATDRILHYLECEGRDGKLSLGQTRKAWAAELGLSHEALYRALAQLSRDGVLRVEGALIEKIGRPG